MIPLSFLSSRAKRGRLRTRAEAAAAIRLAAVVVLAAGGGCGGELEFSDDSGPPGEAEVHQPWGVGATVTVSVQQASGLGGLTAADWPVTSSDDSVLVVESTELDEVVQMLRVQVTGAGSGSADLVVWADSSRSSELGRLSVEVKVPDEILLAAADWFWEGAQDETEVPALDSEVRAVTGEPFTLLTDVRRDGQPVYGRGMVTAVPADDTVTSETVSSTFGRARDWLNLRSSGEATTALEVFAGDTLLRSVDVRSVPTSAIVTLSLKKAPTRDAANGDPLAVVCKASDAEAERVYGVPCGWTFAGPAVGTTTGTVLSYSYTEGSAVTVTAAIDGGRLTAEGVSVEGAEPVVRDAGKLGCQGSTLPLGWGAATLLGLLAKRRGRRRGQVGS